MRGLCRFGRRRAVVPTVVSNRVRTPEFQNPQAIAERSRMLLDAKPHDLGAVPDLPQVRVNLFDHRAGAVASSRETVKGLTGKPPSSDCRRREQ